MQQKVRLRKEALAACEARGHWMRSFQWQHIDHGDVGASSCVKCNMTVAVNTNPPPNGIDIHGEAVALDCERGK